MIRVHIDAQNFLKQHIVGHRLNAATHQEISRYPGGQIQPCITAIMSDRVVTIDTPKKHFRF